jgi:hypothetical protein
VRPLTDSRFARQEVGMPGQYFGKYTGIVQDNRDDQTLGRLKVSVPAIFPEEETVWASPALPYGYFFVPENGTKVYVEFEGGDQAYPLWTAVQYVQGEWAAEAEADPPQLRVLKTAAGHLLIFDDKAGSIELRDGVNGHTLLLDGSGIAVTDGVNGHTITLAAGKVTVEASGGSLELKAGTSRAELSAGSVTVDAGPGSVTVSGTMITIGSAGTVKLGAGAMPALRAGDVGVGNLGAPVTLVPTNVQVLV